VPPRIDEEEDDSTTTTPPSAAASFDISKEQIEKIKEINEKEEAQGGKMFKELMNRAQQQAPPAQSFSSPPPMVPPTPQQQPDMPNLDNLTVEQQAQLFRQMMMATGGQAAAAQQGAYSAAPAPPQQQIKQPFGNGVGPDGRRIGRNRDADAINNSADLYFAQLKRDSQSRNMARYQGDEETANKVFADPGIQELSIRLNPYLQEQQAKEKELLETSEDERLELMDLEEPRMNRDKEYRGISYKEKLQQKKGKAPASHVEPLKSVEEAKTPAAQSFAAPPPVVEPKVDSSTPPPAPAATSPASSPSTTAGELDRSEVRTFMGMLLKHRGGPGFGSGRLQGADVERFEQLSDEIVAKLGQESNTATTGGMTLSTTDSVTAKVDSLIACIDGAIVMYKNSPPELREGVMITLRAALLSGANTLNEIVGSDQMPPSTTSPSSGVDIHSRVNSLISVIEGAIQMYRNSPPELRQPVLITFRAALMSAINTLNGIIADNEVKNFESYQETTGSQAATAKPEQFYDVVPQKTETYSGTDDNLQFLEKVHAKLEAAAGDGKLGLKSGLSAADASELADALAEARGRLVEELDAGIPAAGAASTSNQPSTPSESASTTSKYQEMLAKARAEKEAKNDP
jgi:hypothetical protein